MAVDEQDLALDRELAEIYGQVPLLRLITPTNVRDARKQFLDGGDPEFSYLERPDLSDLRRRLERLSADQANDALIGNLAERLIADVRSRIDLVDNRGTERFFLLSVELFGQVDDATYEAAQHILRVVPPSTSFGETVDAETFAAAARSELDHYRSLHPELRAEVKVSRSTSGVMVESGNLYVAEDTRISTKRIEPVIHHEVGTHILTYENGLAQPLHILSAGLASYDELQEALGVMAEYLTGGLPPVRLRTLAFRVVTARLRSEGATFREAYDVLRTMACPQNVAFTTVMRAFRSGGTTKDAIYLRGLIRLLDHLKAGNDIAPLYVGKISFESIPLLHELSERGVIGESPLVPRFLETEGAKRKLERIRNGIELSELKGSAA